MLTRIIRTAFWLLILTGTASFFILNINTSVHLNLYFSSLPSVPLVIVVIISICAGALFSSLLGAVERRRSNAQLRNKDARFATRDSYLDISNNQRERNAVRKS